jgi:lipopolysaccharide/colanic/teichoic acid biosynthesis glycosyltransferase
MQIASSEIAKAKGSGHRLLVPEQSAAAVGARPVADVAATQLRGDSLAYALAKRTLDLAVATVGLVVAAPLMAAIAVALKLESPGPILFGHIRLGRNGKPFGCLKFRSMRVGAHGELMASPELKRRYVENDYKVPLESDPRVTRIGRFLRKSSLDELPQLFNVLIGSMSLVGPRPIVREELRWYADQAAVLLSVKPGVTGVWQVQGRSRIGYPDRTKVELEAIRSRSFWRDLKILMRSVPAVMNARGSL